MSHNSPVEVYTLGDLAPASGKFGPAHSQATLAQMQKAIDIVTDPRQYTSDLSEGVACVEDRLHRHNPRLAGGAVSLALMHNLVYGGSTLSANFKELQSLGIPLLLHEDCGALQLLVTVVLEKLSDMHADSYTLLRALGVDVPADVRSRIADWAGSLPADYSDTDAARALVSEIDQIRGEHNAVFAAISLEDGFSFTGGPQLQAETDGLLSFVFDPWVARHMAARIAPDNTDDAQAVELLALAFTAQVFLILGGQDLKIAVHRTVSE